LFCTALEKPSFWKKFLGLYVSVFFGFKGFLDFSVEIRSDTKFRPRNWEHPVHHFLCHMITSLVVNYTKTHKSRLTYEIKNNLYIISPKNFQPWYSGPIYSYLYLTGAFDCGSVRLRLLPWYCRLSVRPSVCLWRCVLWLNDTSYSKIVIGNTPLP